MNSSFGTTVARHRRPHFRHCLASGPLADQLCTSRFGEREISTTIYWGLLKQPDNQKTPNGYGPSCATSSGKPSSVPGEFAESDLLGNQESDRKERRHARCHSFGLGIFGVRNSDCFCLRLGGTSKGAGEQ